MKSTFLIVALMSWLVVFSVPAPSCPELAQNLNDTSFQICTLSLDTLLSIAGNDINRYFTTDQYALYNNGLILGASANREDYEGLYPCGRRSQFTIKGSWVLAISSKSLRAVDTGGVLINGVRREYLTGWVTVLLAVQYQCSDSVGWGYLSLSDAVTEPNVYKWKLVTEASVVWLSTPPTAESIDEFMSSQYSLESSIIPTPILDIYTVQDSTEAYVVFDSLMVCEQALRDVVGKIPDALRD